MCVQVNLIRDLIDPVWKTWVIVRYTNLLFISSKRQSYNSDGSHCQAMDQFHYMVCTWRASSQFQHGDMKVCMIETIQLWLGLTNHEPAGFALPSLVDWCLESESRSNLRRWMHEVCSSARHFQGVPLTHTALQWSYFLKANLWHDPDPPISCKYHTFSIFILNHTSSDRSNYYSTPSFLSAPTQIFRYNHNMCWSCQSWNTMYFIWRLYIT